MYEINPNPNILFLCIERFYHTILFKHDAFIMLALFFCPSINIIRNN